VSSSARARRATSEITSAMVSEVPARARMLNRPVALVTSGNVARPGSLALPRWVTDALPAAHTER
jgi:hypothetical protein